MSNDKRQEVPMYDVFELTLHSPDSFDNPFRDAHVDAEFTSPSGRRITVEGFHYGQDQWRVRLSPRQPGRWTFSAQLAGGATPVTQSGSFECVEGTSRGSLRVSPRNCCRLEYEDGTPFYPIGIQTCGYFEVGFDGPNADGSHRRATAAEWCQAFEGVVNLVRWQLGAGTTRGCALPLIPKDAPADRYDTDLAARMDDLLRLQKSHGFSHIMILYQDMSLWRNDPTAFGAGHDLTDYKSLQADNLPLQEQMIRYVVARWGCYVDIWELFNEDAFAPDDYLAHLARVVRNCDPYDRLITTNYARPTADWSDVITWHEYTHGPAEQVDAYITKELALWKSYGKVVLNTEFGNQGMLSNYDPPKWRIGAWTAFMHEGNLLFWGMSGYRFEADQEKPPHNANAYIGPETRQSLGVLSDFTKELPVEMKPISTGYTTQFGVRAYALSNGDKAVVYVHHFADHTTEVAQPFSFGLQTGPGSFRITWINPADGQVVHTDQVDTPQQYLPLKVPAFKIDLACRLDRIG